MATVEIDLPEDLLEHFKALARQCGMTVEDLLIETFEEMLASEGADDDPPSQSIESVLDLRGSVCWEGDLEQSRRGRELLPPHHRERQPHRLR